KGKLHVTPSARVVQHSWGPTRARTLGTAASFLGCSSAPGKPSANGLRGWSDNLTFLFPRPIAPHRSFTTRGCAMSDGTDDRPPAQAQAAAELLPVLYPELRRLAATLTAQRGPSQSLTPTALVHEAFLRLVKDQDPGWQGRRHFFGAAARAMRAILIEQARRKGRLKRGGRRRPGGAGRAPALVG